MAREEWVSFRQRKQLHLFEAKDRIKTALRYDQVQDSSDIRELVEAVEFLEQELADLIDCLAPTNIDYNEECQKYVHRQRQECPYYNEPAYDKRRRARLHF